VDFSLRKIHSAPRLEKATTTAKPLARMGYPPQRLSPKGEAPMRDCHSDFGSGCNVVDAAELLFPQERATLLDVSL
jgi:hypothetical protein